LQLFRNIKILLLAVPLPSTRRSFLLSLNNSLLSGLILNWLSFLAPSLQEM
jgi:hypothetical protein